MRRIVLEGGKDIALSEPIGLGDLAPGKEIQKGIPLKSGHGAAGTRGSGGAVGAAMAVWGGECRFAFRRR